MSMPVVPTKKLLKLEWYEQHQPVWATGYASIGLLTGDATLLGTKNTTARAAYNAHLAAQQGAKAATEAWYNAVADLGGFGATLIKKIGAKAGVDGVGVYALAQVSSPAIPSPVGAPGTPTDFKVELDQSGVLKLSWKCSQPVNSVGVIYQIRRRTTPSAEFAFIGASGRREWIDATLPAGSSAVTYEVVATRSTAIGAPAQFNVNFGVGGAGEATATVAPPVAVG